MDRDIAKCIECPLVSVCVEIGVFSRAELLAIAMILILSLAYEEASHGT